MTDEKWEHWYNFRKLNMWNCEKWSDLTEDQKSTIKYGFEDTIDVSFYLIRSSFVEIFKSMRNLLKL